MAERNYGFDTTTTTTTTSKVESRPQPSMSENLLHISVYYDSFNTRYLMKQKVYEVKNFSKLIFHKKINIFVELVQHSLNNSHRRTDLSVPGGLHCHGLRGGGNNSGLNQQHNELGYRQTSGSSVPYFLNSFQSSSALLLVNLLEIKLKNQVVVIISCH